MFLILPLILLSRHLKFCVFEGIYIRYAYMIIFLKNKQKYYK